MNQRAKEIAMNRERDMKPRIDQDALEGTYTLVADLFPNAKPKAAFVMGSGWTKGCSWFKIKESISYDKIPTLGVTSVQGHKGNLLWVEAEGKEALVFEGRRHVFEGVNVTSLAVPPFLTKRMGAEFMVVTNAAGGIGSHLHPGDLMLLTDHLNPSNYDVLNGEHDSFWGEQFTGLVDLYDPALREQMKQAAIASDANLKEGVYCFWPAKPYQTPAEIQMVKGFGADAVGKSTVPEAILARGAGLRSVAISCISNYAAGINDSRPTHEEVTETVGKSIEKAASMLHSFWQNC